MIEPDLNDMHLCIKCSATISGLENYIEHRKHGCTANHNPSTVGEKLSTTTVDSRPQTTDGSETPIIASANRSNLEHEYETFSFQTEPEPPSTFVGKSEHGGKTTKALCDPYYLPYELGADVFFSSLQLQSVQSSSGPPAASTIKPGTTSQQRLKSNSDQTEVTWIATTPTSTSDQHSTENLMKAVSDISGSKKPYDVGFKPLSFVHEGSLEPSEEEMEEDEEEIDVEIDEEEDEEFDPIASSHASGGKWKPPIMRHSPPVVPITHTGGKWKPENRPNLRMTHTQLTRLSPNWEEPAGIEVQVLDTDEHPPAGHTKGKWIPGTKMQRLEYKEDAELKSRTNLNYWCNICCRKLKNKHIYENHLKTAYHLKRAEPEQQLEKATLGDIKKDYCMLEEQPKEVPIASVVKKRRRRASFIKCDLCKLTMQRHLLGKHLISHYHFRRMQLHPGKSLRMILDNIHAIVLQAPFQCRPCRFYANTEETFLLHWNSAQHQAACIVDGPGNLWCSFCRFECDDSTHMLHHLLSNDHKEVILAINRSVPICISRKVSINCPRCNQSFRYNAQLRRHLQRNHPNSGTAATGTASDHYQSRFQCDECPEVLRSKVALQRHEKYRHFISKYFCAICNLEFDTSCQAKHHRKTQTHRLQAESEEQATRNKRERINKRKRNQYKSKSDNFEYDASNKNDNMLEEHPTHSLNANKDPVQHSVQSQQPADLMGVATSGGLKCKDCHEYYENHAALKTHRDATHPLLCHICMICGQSFALAQALGRHTRKCRPKSAKESSVLNHSLVPESGILDRRGFDNDGKPETSTNTSESWSCDKCNFSASLKSEMIFHRLHHTLGSIDNKQLIACPFCSKSFRKHSLRCHLRQHTNERIFACDCCDQKFSRLHNLKNHKKTMHSENIKTVTKEAKETTKLLQNSEKVEANSRKHGDTLEGQCDVCGKVFRKQYALKQHRLTHSETPKHYACSFDGCRYVAATNSSLKAHQSSHSQQSFRCERDSCSYVGKSAMHLKRHSQLHNQPKKLFNCDKCSFSTRISGHLKRHMRSHTGEKPHKCPHCDFSTALRENLRQHILKTKKHPGKFIYECDLCKTSSNTAIFKTNLYYEFQEHLVRTHEVE